LFAFAGVATAGCSRSSPAAGVPATSLASTSGQETVVASGSSSPGLSAPCFSVSLPAGWVSQTLPSCGLVLNGPDGAGVSISVDTEPIDVDALRDLLAEKYSEVEVIEETVNGEPVLVGTGAVPGAIYIVVQARSATPSRDGYYAQGLTTEPARVPEIRGIFTTIQTVSG